MRRLFTLDKKVKRKDKLFEQKLNMCNYVGMKTANEIIDAIGGTRKVARLVGMSDAVVSMWRKRNAIPRGWSKFFQTAYPHLYTDSPQRANLP